MSRGTARALGWAVARVRFEGAERVPASGGVLLAINHSAYLDGPLVYGLLPRPAVFLVKAEAFRGPVGLVLRGTGQIPVRRGMAERAPLVAALGELAAGGVVGVFPEGTRGGGDVERVEHGIAYLALRSGCPVLPVALHGTADLRRGKEGRPPGTGHGPAGRERGPAGQGRGPAGRERGPAGQGRGPAGQGRGTPGRERGTPGRGRGTPDRERGAAGVRRGWRPAVLVVVGEAVVLPAGGGVGRRTVTAAAEQVRSALAAHVTATRPAPTTTEERA